MSWCAAVLETTYKGTGLNDSPGLLLLLSIQWPADRAGLPACLHHLQC